MKLFIGLLGILFSVTSASASVLEVNTHDSKVFYHPTPLLEVNVLGDANDGGVLTAFLNYDSNVTEAERAELAQKYPGYQLQVVMGMTDASSATFKITELGVEQTSQVKQGQMGPYFNLQVALSATQMREAMKLRSQLASLIQVDLRARSSFTSSVVTERFVTDASFCSQQKVSSMKSLIGAMGQLRKPEQIKNPLTFAALKAEVLERCFEIDPQSVRSFSELLAIPVRSSQVAVPIVAEAIEMQARTIRLDLKPKLQIEIN